VSPRFPSSVIDQMLTRGQITRVAPNRAPVVRRANIDGLVAPITDLPDVLEQLGHLLFGDRAHVGPADGRRSSLELRCDEFARNLLIPQDGVTAWLTRSVGKAERSLVDERTVARLARHFGVTPDAARVQLDRMHLLQATMTSLPSGRTLAYRYGWGPAFDSEQAAANQPRVPRRLLDRAVEAYRVGRLGVNALARLQGRPVADVELALADAGIVVQPVVRKANMDALLARAVARNAT